MFKKLILVAVIAAAGVFALKQARFLGYAKQEVASWRDAIEDQIPVEKKIAQMRKDVTALDRDIERVKTELATAIVRVRDLDGQAAELETVVSAEQRLLLARGQAINEAIAGKPDQDGTVKVNAFSVADAKERLARDVKVWESRKKHLDALRQSLEHHQRIKETLERQFDEMKRQKEELKVAIDAVEFEYKALQLQQMESKYQTDDTRLARIKENLRSLRTKLDIQKEELKLTPKVHEVPSTTGGELTVDEILAPLSK
jgi:chromosome segregation ATPase